ncbi:hypothetical protein [Rhodoblastus sp.]|uniref:hypothetical protein n=1 Tax=Rhodoblastus sp. TaxID=1962975 RepID=UPI003F95AE0D
MKKPPPENNDRKNLQHEGARSDPAPKVRQPGKPKMDGAALKEVLRMNLADHVETLRRSKKSNLSPSDRALLDRLDKSDSKG